MVEQERKDIWWNRSGKIYGGTGATTVGTGCWCVFKNQSDQKNVIVYNMV